MKPAWVFESSDINVKAISDYDELKRLFVTHPLMIFRRQKLSESEFLDFMRHMGQPVEQKFRRALVVEMSGKSQSQLSSTSELGWHADESYQPVYPEALTLFAVQIPKDTGCTHWANLQAAYASLDSDLKIQLEGLTAHHEFQNFDGYLRDLVEFESDEKKRMNYAYGKCAHPVVGTWHGSKFLRLNHGFTARIVNAAEDLLPRLLEHIVSVKNVYSHAWQEGDLVVSNNHTLIHRRDRFRDAKRLLYRGLFNLN